MVMEYNYAYWQYGDRIQLHLLTVWWQNTTTPIDSLVTEYDFTY